MRIEVKLLLTFKKALAEGQRPFYLELDSPATVAQALALLPIPPDSPKVVLLNGRHATGEEKLRAGDQIAIFPPIEGG